MTKENGQSLDKVIVIIPAFNEKNKIGKTVASVPRQVAQIILVIDDGSTDTTKAEAEAHGATVLRFEKQQGVGAGLRAGYAYAAAHGFDIAVVMAGTARTTERKSRF
jgi:glycosyltransferase involved in cell wall biosynthesis